MHTHITSMRKKGVEMCNDCVMNNKFGSRLVLCGDYRWYNLWDREGIAGR